MASKIDQKAYLQKYLSGSRDKKKKKKKVAKGSGFRIIDDDIDLSKLRPLEGDEIDILGEGEDAPQIAGIIDERPEEVKKLELFKTTSKWRVINQDDGFNSKIQIEEIKKDVKEVEKENELIFGKMYSDSEDDQEENSVMSSTRKQQTNEKPPKNNKPQSHSDSDLSPPRNNKETKSKDTLRHKSYVSDLSPTRKNDKTKRNKSKSEEIKKDTDSDLSPPRKNEKSQKRVKKPSRWGDFKEEEERYKRYSQKSPPLYQRSSRSPERKKIIHKHNISSDSDMSPPRKTKKIIDIRASDSDLSPPRKTNKSYDSDLSPPRKSKQIHLKNTKISSRSNISPSRKRNISPQRQSYSKDKYDKYSSNSSSKYAGSDYYSDKRNVNNEMSRNFRNESRRSSKGRDYNSKKSNSTDHLPPRNDRNKGDNKRKNARHSDSPPPTNKKMAKTLEGKKAGLQDALELRQENEAFKRREEEAFSKMTDEVSGRNAQVVSRKSKRETSEERRKQKEKIDKQKELDEKYKKWGKGLKQIEDQEKRVQEFMHEASKPLARHKGDRDLEDRLRDVEREGDPMLQYIREKKRDRGELEPEKPTYKGSFPPNRFNIRPGYRWDGVDRSNGYEKKFFDQQSKRKAQAEEAYKWSTEDL